MRHGDEHLEAGLRAFLDAHADRCAEVVWAAALVLIERASLEARESGRWRVYPRGELRRLRRDLAAALRLARLAIAFQEAENAIAGELTAALRREAEAAGRRARRAQTLEAERVRLEKAARRRQERR